MNKSKKTVVFSNAFLIFIVKFPSSPCLSKGEFAFTELEESGKLGWDAPSLTLKGLCCLFICVFACERQVLTVRSSLAWNSLCSPDQPQSLDNPPASASHCGSTRFFGQEWCFCAASLCSYLSSLSCFLHLEFQKSQCLSCAHFEHLQSKKLSSLRCDCCFDSS